MTRLLKFATAALICASSIANAQTRISDIQDEVSSLSNYMTINEKMSSIEQDILSLTHDLLIEPDSGEQLAIRNRIEDKQNKLLEMKREIEKNAEKEPENRTVRIFQGDLTKSDLTLKTFKTKYDPEIKQLSIAIRAESNDQATISLLSPGKEILHQKISTPENGRHNMVVDLSKNQYKTLCINISANEKLITKIISL